MVRPMVHSNKHYVQVTFSTVLTLARNAETLVNAVGRQDANVGTEVVEGSTVKAVFLELWAEGTTADQFFTFIIVKLPGGLGNPTFTEMTDLYTWDNKKNILFTSQALASNDGVGNPLPLFRGWIKIPKGKQRFGLGDTLSFLLASRGDASINYCGFATYKEYS